MKKLLLVIMLSVGLFAENHYLCKSASDSYWSGYDRLVVAIQRSNLKQIRISYKIMNDSFYDTQEHCPDSIKILFRDSMSILDDSNISYIIDQSSK